MAYRRFCRIFGTQLGCGLWGWGVWWWGGAGGGGVGGGGGGGGGVVGAVGAEKERLRPGRASLENGRKSYLSASSILVNFSRMGSAENVQRTHRYPTRLAKG